jgi:hypothetical protein
MTEMDTALEKFYNRSSDEQFLLEQLEESLPIFAPLRKIVIAYMFTGPLEDIVLFPRLKMVKTCSFRYHGRRFYYAGDRVVEDKPAEVSSCCLLC